MIKMIVIYLALFFVFFAGIYGVKSLSKSPPSEKKEMFWIALYSTIAALLACFSVVVIVLLF